jgi:magnesium transporter
VSSGLDLALGAVNQAFLRGYPGEVARGLEALPIEEAVVFLEQQPPGEAASAVERLTLDQGELVLAALHDDFAASVVARIDPTRAAALLARQDEPSRERRLAQLSPAAAREIRDLIRYPAESAGSLMDPRVRLFRPESTAREVLDRLRAAPERRLHVVYVVDEEGRLAGALPLQDVALADPETRLDALVLGLPASVQATDGRQQVIDEFETRRVPSLPVVDADERMLGVIRHAALVEAAQEEASVDLQTMVGASRDERALSPSFFAVRRRLPWLQVNLLTAFLASSVVGLFEDTIARFTALAVLPDCPATPEPRRSR